MIILVMFSHSIELRVYKSDSHAIVNPPTESIPSQPIPQHTTPPVTTPKHTPELIEPDEDVKYRSVSSHSSRRSTASKK